MARIAYPDPSNTEIAPLVKRIIAERGRLANLYKMLLHSPPVAEGWLSFLTAIRYKCSLAGRVRGLIMPEINYGQMVLELERCAGGLCPVLLVPHAGGSIIQPDRILTALDAALKETA